MNKQLFNILILLLFVSITSCNNSKNSNQNSLNNIDSSKLEKAGTIPPPLNDQVESLCEYTPTMLIDKENINADRDGYIYGNPKIIYGIITEVDKDITQIRIHIVKSSKAFNDYFRKLDGEDWNVSIDNNSWGGNSEMDHSCSLNFSFFFVPGRRMKFGMVEGYPGCGTSEAGHWHLTYAKAIDGNQF